MHTLSTSAPQETEILTVEIPCVRKQEALAILKKLGATLREEERFDTELAPPSTILRGCRHRECLTQIELAKLTGISQRHISQMENGKLPIGKERAKRFAEIFQTDYRLFL